MTVTTPGRVRPPVRRALAGRRIAGALVAATSWGLALATLALSAVFGLPVIAHNEFVSLYVLNAVAWGSVSGLLLSGRPSAAGVVLAVAGVGGGVSALSAQLARIPGSPLDPGISQHVLERLWLPGALATLSIVPLVLVVRPLGRATTALVAAGAVAAVLPWIAGVVRQRTTAAPNPLAPADPTVQELAAGIAVVFLAISVLLGAVTAVVLVVRWWRTPVEARRGLGALALAQILSIVFFGPTFLAWLPPPLGSIGERVPFAPALAVVFLAVAVVVAALGQRRTGTDAYIDGVVVDVLLLVVLILVYVSIAVPTSLTLPVPPTIAGAAGVAALALTVAPLRRWVQARVDALVYGDAADPATLLARLGRRPGEPGEGLATLVAELRDALRLGHLEVRSAEPGEPAVVAGEPSGAQVAFPLRGADATIGWVSASGENGHRPDGRTRRVLERISGVLTVALQLETVNRELEETRDRILGVGADERRMVRRELRDGLAPALARSEWRLRSAPALIALDPEAARAEVAAVRAEIAARATEVRDLARTLLPGALDAGDLEAALGELASRFSSERLAITAVSAGTRGLDPARQSALHHLAAEAVLLLRRAPDVRRADVVLDVDDGRATLRVVADAPFTTTPRASATLASLAARADELGAELGIEPEGDGIRVVVPR